MSKQQKYKNKITTTLIFYTLYHCRALNNMYYNLYVYCVYIYLFEVVKKKI